MTATTTFRIDWLSVTIPIDAARRQSIADVSRWGHGYGAEFTKDRSKWRLHKPMFGYTEAWVSQNGTIVLYGMVEMGAHVIYSAQTLQKLQRDGVSTRELVDNVLTRGGRATRVDIAMDMVNVGARICDFRGEIESGEARCKSRKWSELTGSNGGSTLYIGSRSSERMTRIYNKKAERAANLEYVDCDTWIRCEVELKGLQARNFLFAARDNGLTEAMVGAITSTVNFPRLPDWTSAISTTAVAPIAPTPTRRKDTKTRHWLLSTVAPVIAREAKDDGEFLEYLMREIRVLIGKH